MASVISSRRPGESVSAAAARINGSAGRASCSSKAELPGSGFFFRPHPRWHREALPPGAARSAGSTRHHRAARKARPPPPTVFVALEESGSTRASACHRWGRSGIASTPRGHRLYPRASSAREPPRCWRVVHDQFEVPCLVGGCPVQAAVRADLGEAVEEAANQVACRGRSNRRPCEFTEPPARSAAH